jgi:hypothetical protein
MSAGDPEIFLNPLQNPRIEAGMTPDFFRARLGEMVNPKDPLVVLARQMPWDEIETYLARFFVRQG